MKKIEVTEKTRVTTRNDFITASGLNVLTVKERQLLYLAISQCKKDDKEFFKYSISAMDFAELTGTPKNYVYDTALKMCERLASGYIKIADGKQFKIIPLFALCQYDESKIEFELNERMKPFLLGLKNRFTQPLLADFLRMKSANAMAIWHLIQRDLQNYELKMTDTIIFDLDLAELKAVTGADKEKAYDRPYNFKIRVLEPALKNIHDSCHVAIQYEDITKGRKLIGFRCTARKTNYISPSDIPDRIKEKQVEIMEKVGDTQGLKDFDIMFRTNGVKRKGKKVSGKTKSDTTSTRKKKEGNQ